MKYSTALRNASANAKIAEIGNGATLTIYSGTQPATPDTTIGASVALATIVCGTPFGTVSNGIITASSLPLATANTGAVATGVASWFRLTKAGGGAVIDGSVGVGSSFDLQIATIAISQNVQVQITAWTIIGGNA